MHRPLGAQGTGGVRTSPVSIDVGAAAVRFRDDSTTIVGPTLGATGRAESRHGFVHGTAGGVVTAGALSGSAQLRVRLRGAFAQSLGWELDGEGASVVGSSTAGSASSAIGGVRLRWTAGALGTWIGGDAHVAQRPHSTPTGNALSAGAWWRWGSGQASASLSKQWSGAELYGGRLRTQYAGTVPVRYVEAVLGLHWDADRASIDVDAGARRDEGAARLYEPLVSATAALWSSDTRAFVFGVSRQLPDFVRGADAADILSVGMRIRQASPALERSTRIMPVVQVADSGGTRMLRVRAAGAHSVEVMGDFSDWTPIALTAAGGVFEHAIALGSGAHHLVVRIDGRAWRPAANTPSVDDDLGGRVGLLVVP